jgi:hypothetical protein
MRARATLISAAVAVALAAVAPVAHADKVTASIDPDAAGQGRYFGKVKAKRDSCVKNRTVQVYDQSAGGFFIGDATTNAKGHWELFEFVPQPGQEVRILVLEKNKGKGRCKALHTIAAVPEDPGVP